jgi:arylsulfatase A-like enzyme
MYTSRIVWLALLASLVCAIAAPASAQLSKPNILFILADNIGYGDIGAARRPDAAYRSACGRRSAADSVVLV